MEWSGIGIYALVLGLLVFSVALYFFVFAADTRAWAEWPAHVDESELDNDGDGGWSVLVTYRWDVNGETHRRRERLQRWPATKGSATRILSAFSRGTEITAYLDPAKPSRSRLRPGVRVDHWIWLVIGALIFVAGLASITGVLD